MAWHKKTQHYIQSQVTNTGPDTKNNNIISSHRSPTQGLTQKTTTLYPVTGHRHRAWHKKQQHYIQSQVTDTGPDTKNNNIISSHRSPTQGLTQKTTTLYPVTGHKHRAWHKKQHYIQSQVTHTGPDTKNNNITSSNRSPTQGLTQETTLHLVTGHRHRAWHKKQHYIQSQVTDTGPDTKNITSSHRSPTQGLTQETTTLHPVTGHPHRAWHKKQHYIQSQVTDTGPDTKNNITSSHRSPTQGPTQKTLHPVTGHQHRAWHKKHYIQSQVTNIGPDTRNNITSSHGSPTQGLTQETTLHPVTGHKHRAWHKKQHYIQSQVTDTGPDTKNITSSHRSQK